MKEKNIYLKAVKQNAEMPSGKKLWSLEDRDKILTDENIAILDHPAKKKIIVASKDASKTFMVKGQEIALLNMNDYFSTLDMRKYQKDAVQNLSGSWYKFLNYVKLTTDVDVPDYEMTSTSKLVKMPMNYKKKGYINKNLLTGSVMYSFDNQNGLAGIEAPNAGTFVLIHVDEPVLKDDPGKLPTRKEWESSIKTIDDSVSRHRRSFRQLHPDIEVPKLQWYFTMNPWDEHPLIEDTNKYFPEDKFLKFILGTDIRIKDITQEWLKKHWTKVKASILKNHTKAVYRKEADELYVRRTKLANPEMWFGDEEAKKDLANLMRKIYQALLHNDNLELSRILGLQYAGSDDKPFTWNVNNWKEADLETEINDGWEVKGNSIAWDIDVNRQMTGTSAVFLRRGNDNKVHIRPQIIIKANGAGKYGEKNDLYIKQIAKATDKEMSEINVISGYNIFKNIMRYFYVDEDKKFYLNELKKNKYISRNFRGFGLVKKHASFGIIQRQDLVQIGMDTEWIEFDPANKLLRQRIEACVNTPGTSKRNTNGNKNKLDEIDSFEYSLYPWRAKINFKKGGLNG